MSSNSNSFWRILMGDQRQKRSSSREERVPILGAADSTDRSASDVGAAAPETLNTPAATKASTRSNTYETFPRTTGSFTLNRKWRQNLKRQFSNFVSNHPSVMILLLLCVVFGGVLQYHHGQINASWAQQQPDSSTPQWMWDHNHYAPGNEQTINIDGSTATGTTTNSQYPHNLLLAQVSSSTTIMIQQASITSRTNRAYAKQWGLDYLLYQSDDSQNSCAVKTVLEMIMETQHNYNKNATQSTPARRPYDAVLFLPSQAIITNFDFNLMSLLKSDKLLGVVRDNNNEGQLLFWNLQHNTSTVAAVKRLFHDDDCSVVVSPTIKQDSSSYVTTIPLSADGFVEPRLIQYQPPISSDLASLAATADSVCYRFYPKCEVL